MKSLYGISDVLSASAYFRNLSRTDLLQLLEEKEVTFSPHYEHPDYPEVII